MISSLTNHYSIAFKRKTIVLALFTIAFVYSSIAQTSTTRIFFVRHADREKFDDLNSLGLNRANELNRTLFNTGIESIFSTKFVRTKKNGNPACRCHWPAGDTI